jgi:hypothetical protein
MHVHVYIICTSILHIAQVQREAQEVEVSKMHARENENLAHNVALRSQISDNHELRQRNRQEFLDEGAKQRSPSPPTET